MTFNEANTAEGLVTHTLTRLRGLRWRFVPARDLSREERDVCVWPLVTEALVRLNPEIAARPALAEEVIYKLQAILHGARANPVRANEEFTSWLRGEQTLPFGENHEHVPVRLIDFADPANNDFVVTQQYTYRAGTLERRFDTVLLVNGLPLGIGEVKSTTRPSVSWQDGAKDFLDDYWKNCPAMFAPNVLCFASEGKTFRYAALGGGYEHWAPWRETTDRTPSPLEEVSRAVQGLLRPETLLKMLRDYSIFPVVQGGRKVKVLARYPQVEATEQIVARVVQGQTRRGLIWHFQGSGKSLLMAFAAQKLKTTPALRNPTVIIVVDRTDLNSQIGATFDGAQVPNTVTADSRRDLERLLREDTRQTIITTIHKFGEADGVLNARENIVVLVDEAHRTQEGDLGRKMRAALPNAFLFGLTGTPVARGDRNTFAWFGASEDEDGFLNHYSYSQSIRDGATLPVHFEPRPAHLKVDRAAVDAGMEVLAGDHGLTDADTQELVRRAGRMEHLFKAPARLSAIADDIAAHFRTRVAPAGFKGQVVMFDREACVRMKGLLDERLGEDVSEVVMITQPGDLERWQEAGLTVTPEQFARWTELDKDAGKLEKLLSRFRDPRDPLQLLIVTSKLLTGFDAPINQVMYLDKPLRDHTLLQAICRTNRLYPGKTSGLVVDYLGVFDDVAKALDFDPESIKGVIQNIAELEAGFPAAMRAALAHFPGVDRSVDGFEGLMAAQQALATPAARDEFAADFSVVHRLWEVLSPSAALAPFETDYRWLGSVYESLRPPSGIGVLLWHALGAKTIDLIHRHVTVDHIEESLDTLVLEESVLGLLSGDQAEQKGKQITLAIERVLRKKGNVAKFELLGERLQRLQERYAQGLTGGLAWLKELLALAREVLETEQQEQVEIIPDGKSALTALFEEHRGEETPEIVGRIVGDIDELVRAARFDGWQHTTAGDRAMRQALRRALLKYKLHTDEELFDRAYGYIQQYY
ncbi:type I restriction endonuclease subunit R [Deinococcus sp. NW-56]|uniref:type I restriction endonuclease subunit R n=1 Tax=Deinococcus sp. NW-56 TaxID=2080419 RepID=UPI000CF3EF22|nr:type I restriction endonuclease subunit R [Deinococcus sp. NW-56]